MPTAKTPKAPKTPKTSKDKTLTSFESDIYNIEGKAIGKISLPEDIFGLNWNADLVHQVLVSEMSNKRTPVAHTKTRGEVRGGGKKPWKQKGTGRARHGSTRSPIWVGGGVAHGPRNDKNYSKKINRKMKAKALLTILAKKYKDGEIVFIDKIVFDAPKAKYAKTFFDNLGKVEGFNKLSTKKKNAAYIAMSKDEGVVKRSFTNFGNVAVGDIRNINPVDVATYKYLVITNPEEAVKTFASKVK
jgi:large subunit ribosomal protein L4